MAKLSHLEKEYIKANYKNKSIDELRVNRRIY